jgi:hypothetical protein
MCQSHGHHTILPRKSGELFSPLPLPGICICSLPFSKMVYLSSTEFFCQYKYPNLLQNSDPEEMRNEKKTEDDFEADILHHHYFDSKC